MGTYPFKTPTFSAYLEQRHKLVGSQAHPQHALRSRKQRQHQVAPLPPRCQPLPQPGPPAAARTAAAAAGEGSPSPQLRAAGRRGCPERAARRNRGDCNRRTIQAGLLLHRELRLLRLLGTAGARRPHSQQRQREERQGRQQPGQQEWAGAEPVGVKLSAQQHKQGCAQGEHEGICGRVIPCKGGKGGKGTE